MPVMVCSEASMKKKQRTPCAAIPDSGTTLIMAPARDITKLFAELCRRWPRCVTKMKTSRRKKSSEVFMQLLGECADWLTHSEGLDEIPSIFFHVAGARGEKYTIELTSWSYIAEAFQEEVEIVTKRILGIFPVKKWVPTNRLRKICIPQFGEQEYSTPSTGPIYVIETPLFYELQVQFKRHPPSIG